MRRADIREAELVEHPWINRLVARLYPSPPSLTVTETPEPREVPVLTVDAMSPYPAPTRNLWHDGEKYPGGFGFTELLTADYWTLRARSQQLFRTNIYARGIVRRLCTNIISTGLELESQPHEKLLGFEPGSLLEWSEDVEDRFALWSNSPSLCDYKGLQSFGSLQAAAKMAALVSGDVLVVLHQDAVTGLPKVRLVDGSRVQSPFGVGRDEPNIPVGHTVRHGVERNPEGKQVAYWIVTDDETTERRVQRLPAVGATGRRVAWLVYGTDKLLDDVRGEPILSIILQSLREIDRYRDATQRKAAIGATLAVFIKRDKENLSTRHFTGNATGGAVRRTSSPGAGSEQPTKRTYNIADAIPGAVFDDLAPGEEPQGFASTTTDQHFPEFERCLISSIAWALEIPPEILTLSFSSNYSASQAAIQELRLTLQPWRHSWAEQMCAPIYVDWLLSEVLGGRIKADGLLESWRDPTQHTTFNAWIGSDFIGAIKPHIDMTRTAAGYTQLIADGLITRDRAAREITGMKYSKVVARLEVENEMLAKANRSLQPPVPAASTPSKPNLKVVPNDDDEKEDAG